MIYKKQGEFKTMIQKAQQIMAEVQKVVVGKEEIIAKVLMVMLAKGHVLIEDIPGAVSYTHLDVYKRQTFKFVQSSNKSFANWAAPLSSSNL